MDFGQQIIYKHTSPSLRNCYINNNFGGSVSSKPFQKIFWEMRWNIFFFHRIPRNHRFFFKNSPQSPHFLQQFTQKPRPGMRSVVLIKISIRGTFLQLLTKSGFSVNLARFWAASRKRVNKCAVFLTTKTVICHVMTLKSKRYLRFKF